MAEETFNLAAAVEAAAEADGLKFWQIQNDRDELGRASFWRIIAGKDDRNISINCKGETKVDAWCKFADALRMARPAPAAMEPPGMDHEKIIEKMRIHANCAVPIGSELFYANEDMIRSAADSIGLREIVEALAAVRDRFFRKDQPERDRDLMWDQVNDALARYVPLAEPDPEAQKDPPPREIGENDKGHRK